VRFNFIIDDDKHKKLKIKAAEQGTTITALLNEAIDKILN